jgi:ABC-type glutathione transport system ATPase component
MSNDGISQATLAAAVLSRGLKSPLIVCKGLGKSYAVRIGKPVVTLENLNIEIPVGEFLAVVGPACPPAERSPAGRDWQ